MRALIVATDFSKEAENAVEFAGAAAQYTQAKVVLFNSFNIPLHVSNARLPATVFKELLDNNTSMLKKRALELSEKYAIEVEYDSSFLELNDELENLFLKHDADMVIMGTAAYSLGQELFGNSTTAAIMKQKFPVLAVPMGVKFSPIKKILYACDVLRGINVRILDMIKDFAQLTDAEVVVFHVQNNLRKLQNTVTEQTKSDQISESLEGISHSYKNIQSEMIIDEIKKEIKHIQADLLIMVPQRYGFWQSLIHKSKTRIMASQSEIPLLSIPI
jgi:nucleotide-binding universal stress UspA family protein